MILNFYGLREQPFGVTPDPRFLYLSASHKEALASLYCGIENNRGFSALVAPPGMGKTSLLFRMLESLKGKARTAFLFQTDFNSHEFLRSLLMDLGLDECGGDLVSMRATLNAALLEERRAGRRFVLVIDEAQSLSPEVLESVRLLSNFETPTEKLVHIVLAGQPQLAATLRGTEMKQLAQRVSTLIVLQPFSSQDTQSYIRHRLSVAGCADENLFTKEAFEIIARASEGIPRNINALCFQSLSIGCALEKRKIDSRILNEVLVDLNGASAGQGSEVQRTVPRAVDVETLPDLLSLETLSTVRAGQRPRAWKWAAALGAAVVLPSLLWFELGPRLKANDGAGALSESVKVAAAAEPAAESKTVVVPEVVEPPTDAIVRDEKLAIPSRAGQFAGEAVLPREVPQDSAVPPLKNGESADGRTPQFAAPASVQPGAVFADRTETIFELALDHYGKSNRAIVDKIIAANPTLRDPYAIIEKGQRIVLPGADQAVGAMRGANKELIGRGE